MANSPWKLAATDFTLPPATGIDPTATARGREQTPAQVRSAADEQTLRRRLDVEPVALTIVLDERQRDLCFHYAKNAETGGRSNIYKGDKATRDAMTQEQQRTGQLGTLAMLIWQLGPERGEAEYRTGREAIDANPTKGDGGSDITGGNEDAKATLRRRPDKPLYDYNLVVRPREQHAGTVYVQCIVELDMRTVHLLGWATCEELQARDLHDKTRFGDAALLPARELHPLPPFRWAGL